MAERMGHTFGVGAWAPEIPVSGGTQAPAQAGIRLVVGADMPRTLGHRLLVLKAGSGGRR